MKKYKFSYKFIHGLLILNIVEEIPENYHWKIEILNKIYIKLKRILKMRAYPLHCYGCTFPKEIDKYYTKTNKIQFYLHPIAKIINKRTKDIYTAYFLCKMFVRHEFRHSQQLDWLTKNHKLTKELIDREGKFKGKLGPLEYDANKYQTDESEELEVYMKKNFS